MNVRCAFCQTPYTLSRVAMLDALQEMDSKNLTHYDAHCPRCKRATPIPRQRMEMAMPKWRDELKEFEAEMKEHPQPAAPAPESKPEADAQEASEPASRAETPSKPTAKAEAEKKPANKQKPAAKSSSQEKKATAKKSK